MIYSAFLRHNDGDHNKSRMIRVEADSMVEAAQKAEEENIAEDCTIHLITRGYGSPRMF